MVTLLTVVLGVILLLAGIGFLLIAAIAQLVTEFTNVNSAIMVNGTNVPIANPIFTFLGPVGLVIAGYILLGIGFISFLVSYGLFRGHGWAWTATLILSFTVITLGVIFVLSGDFVSTAIIFFQGIIIYCLYKPSVKSYFGKSQILTR